MTSGVEVIERVAIENSINPRLLLALLEYESHWVYGQKDELNLAQRTYPMGLIDKNRESLYRQLVWAVKDLSIGYYGWREGLLTDLSFADGVTVRLAPELNAGTVALQYYFSQQRSSETWPLVLSVESGFPALYQEMFGNPWMRAQTVEPLYPPDLSQPPADPALPGRPDLGLQRRAARRLGAGWGARRAGFCAGQHGVGLCRVVSAGARRRTRPDHPGRARHCRD